MAFATVDDIAREINRLLDEQLVFLSSDLYHVSDAAFTEYDFRYQRIRSLCDELDRYSPASSVA